MPNENEQVEAVDHVQDTPEQPSNNEVSFIDVMKSEAQKAQDKLQEADNEAQATAEPKTVKSEVQDNKSDVTLTDNQAQQEPAQAQVTTNQEVINAPHSWNAEIKQEWGKLPPNVQKYIAQRDLDTQRKLTEANQEVHFSREVKQSFEPYQDVLKQLNATHKQALDSFLPAVKTLYTGSVMEKLNLIKSMAEQHHIPLGMLFSDDQEAFNQLQMQHLQHQNRQVQQSNQNILQQRQQEQQQNQQSNLNSIIEKFKADKSDFDLLSNDIANLLHTPAYADLEPMQALQQAYETAKYINPQARENILNAQLKERQDKEKAEIQARTQAKKNASSSLKNSGGYSNSNQQSKSFIDEMRRQTALRNKQV